MKKMIPLRIGVWTFLGIVSVAGLSLKVLEAQEASTGPGLTVSPPLKVKEDVRVSMDLKDANIKDVLKILSQQAGLNFVASEEVQDKRLTLYLDQVTVTDALTNIVSANQLEYVQVPGSNIFVIRKKGAEEGTTLTKVYKLKYARVSTSALEKGASNVMLEAGTRAAASGTAGTGSGASVSGGGAAAGGGGKTLRGLDLVLEKLVTEKGIVVTDPRTNSVIVTDVPSQFKAIDQAIAKLDRPVPQVLIEAEILETAANLAQKLGVQWGDSSTGALLGGTASSIAGDFPFNFKSETPTGVSAPTSLTLGSLNASNLGFILNALHSNTDTKILARPRVLVLDNEGAVIDLTSQTAIASVTSVAQTSGGLSTQASNSAERTQTGVSLRVTPQINDNDHVTLFVEPAVITASDSKFFSGKFVDPQTRAARTTVMVKDGNTLVIGGLINTEDTEINRKVPVLGDIPILGLAFRKKQVDRIDKEVIVFLTPHIVRISETPFPEEILASDQPVTVQLPEKEQREIVAPRSKEQEIEKILDQLSAQPE